MLRTGMRGGAAHHAAFGVGELDRQRGPGHGDVEDLPRMGAGHLDDLCEGQWS
jgi:hypothetical protein